MTPETRPGARFEPLHDAHAIDQALFVVQFGNALDDGAYQELLNLAEPYSKELPGRMDAQGFPASFGALSMPGVAAQAAQAVQAVGFQLGIPMLNPFQAPPSALPGARILRSSRRDGTMENELKVDRNSITFRTSAYEGWDVTWGKVGTYFLELLPVYAKTLPVSTVGLTFVDKFVWTGDIEACKPNLLLRPASKYVAPYVYDITDLWHNHTGHFIRATNQIKRLLNVNVDYIDENLGQTQRRVVGITTVVTDLMNQPTYDQLDLGGGSLADFCAHEMNELHALSKEVFGFVINDAMSHRIGLKERT